MRIAPPLSVRIETPDQDDVRSLLAASDAFHAALYPAESNHLVDLAALRGPAVSFFVARIGGVAAGCGALVRHAAFYGEIKRMFVWQDARGRKVGGRILDRLETRARRLGIACLRLETGVRQPEAVGFYRSAGFGECAAFGDYRPDPLSIFMEKRLG